MSIGNTNTRLSKVAREFNVGIQTIVEFLHKKGFDVDSNPNTKISDDAYHLLEKEYKSDISLKKESEKINLKSQRTKKETITLTTYRMGPGMKPTKMIFRPTRSGSPI